MAELHGIGSACTEPERRMTTREVGADVAASSCCSAHSSVAAGRHPLDPLDGDEMARAAKIVAAAFGKDEPIRFERLEI
jgi:Cu2+-containing amine oxidase